MHIVMNSNFSQFLSSFRNSLYSPRFCGVSSPVIQWYKYYMLDIGVRSVCGKSVGDIYNFVVITCNIYVTFCVLEEVYYSFLSDISNVIVQLVCVANFGKPHKAHQIPIHHECFPPVQLHFCFCQFFSNTAPWLGQLHPPD